MQTWPALRNLHRMAPATAASRSASSKIRKGALPPSSSEIFLTWPAHCAISSLPTAVEPVKPILRTVGLPVSSPPIAGASSASPVTIWKTPGGDARAIGELGQRERRERRLLGRLADDRVAGGQRRRGLARDHRRGEVPGRDAAAHADRLLEHDDARAGLLGRDRVAVDALGLLAEPLQEGRRVADLGVRLGQRLALLARQDHGQVAAVAEHEVGEAAQDRGALARRPRAPGGQRRRRRLDRAARLGDAHARHLGQHLAARRIVHRERRARVGRGPGAVDVAAVAQQGRVVDQQHAGMMAGGAQEAVARPTRRPGSAAGRPGRRAARRPSSRRRSGRSPSRAGARRPRWRRPGSARPAGCPCPRRRARGRSRSRSRRSSARGPRRARP